MRRILAPAIACWLVAFGWARGSSGLAQSISPAPGTGAALDDHLADVLRDAGFTGTIEWQAAARLGRPIDSKLANLGRLLWFDKIHSLHHDNTCGGCHSPTNGFGDSQGIAIGVQNNNVVGPGRTGPRNQRRSPLVINAALYPALMWNGRFRAPTEDPFDNSQGFLFPPPESLARFPPNDPRVVHLLQAQAHLPPTELIEVAGFSGTAGTLGPRFDQFDDGMGEPVPAADGSGFRNDPIRARALQLINGVPDYRRRFGEIFPSVASGADIDFFMFGQAIAEFEFTLVFANAPIDRFARGDRAAMSAEEKRGALLFFGKAGCVRCHAVAGRANEMFSDFQNHVVGVPQIAPRFGVGRSNVIFDGPDEDEDFGAEQVSGDAAERYKFRTAPLRNLALSPAYFHNGAFTSLDDAMRHHLNVYESARQYDAKSAGIDRDLRDRLGPIEPVLSRLDPLLQTPTDLTPPELADLARFVRDSLLDPRATRPNLCRLIPRTVPSGMSVPRFEQCGR
jgi:cytochrome c peroxidase